MYNLGSTDNFKFHGFSPSSKLRVYCKEIYSLVEDKAPGESAKVAFITKTDEGYVGGFRVASATGVFEVGSKNREPFDLIEELYKKMSLQILDWNQNRHF